MVKGMDSHCGLIMRSSSLLLLVGLLTLWAELMPISGQGSPVVPSVHCQLPAETGPCEGRIERYFYSPAQKKCLTFNYGGCRGNSNNFETKEACEEACGTISPERPTEGAAGAPSTAKGPPKPPA